MAYFYLWAITFYAGDHSGAAAGPGNRGAAI